MPTSAGEVLGDYRIVQLLGRGGMGTVYRGVHRETGDAVAIKTVDAPNERFVQSIRREVRALTRLRHPGIVRVVAEGVDGGLPWYAMELIEGVTLKDACQADAVTVDEGGAGGSEPTDRWWTRTLGDLTGTQPPIATARPGRRLSLDRLLTLARSLCGSLAYLHGEGVVHRDLKPDNVIVRPGDDAVIVDFGLASHLRGPTSRETLEVRGDTAGTAAYMAPEVIRGDAVDARADLYALGCIVYELATGRKPFSAFTMAAVLLAHLELTPPRPSQWAADLPPALDDLVMSLLEKDPRKRLGHADNVASVLESLGARPPSRSGPPPRAYLYRPGFVGRQRTMAALDEELARVGERGPRLVLVRGESGVGKTRLVNERGARAAASGFTVLEGECASAGSRPLEAFRNPLERIADRCRERGSADVARILGARAKVLAPYQASLSSLPGLDGLAEPPPLPPDAARLRVFGSLCEVLERLAAQEPLLIILDDLQWADRLTLELLSYLMRQPLERAHLIILATYRTDEGHDVHESLSGLDGVTHLEVGRLEEQDVQAMVSDMLGSQPSSELTEYVSEQSEGIPFFVAEYLRAAVDGGLLHRDTAGAWQLDERHAQRSLVPALSVPLPGALRELVQRRLAGLGESAARLLELAAVMGRETEVATLLAASDLDEASFLDALDELVRRHVLEDTGETRVRFTHDKLREASYAAIDENARRALHLRAAQTFSAQESSAQESSAQAFTAEASSARALSAHALSAQGPAAEKLPRAATEPQYDVLVHHWRQAGVTHEAVNALERAGARALSQCAYKQAADCYREALDTSSDDDPRRARWERSLAEAALGLGDHAQGQRRLLRALSLQGTKVAASHGQLALIVAADVVRQVGHRLLPTRLVQRHDGQASLLRDTRIHQRLVETYWFENDVPRMVSAALRALNLAERAGPSPELARAYATMCLSAGSVPIHPLAEHYAALAVRTAEAADDPASHAYALFLNSVYRVGAAKWARVDTDLGLAADICTRIGDARFLGESLTVLGMASLYQGRFERAQRLFLDAGDSGRRFGNVQHRLWSAIGLAEARLRAQDLAGAHAHLDAAFALLEMHAQTAESFRAHGLRASVQLAAGDLVGAIRAADEAEVHLGKLLVPTAHYLLEGYAGVADVRLAQLARARPGPARLEERAARRAERALRTFAMLFRIAGPRARGVRGTLRWLEGDRGRAVADWQAAARSARRLGMRYEATRAREIRTRHAG